MAAEGSSSDRVAEAREAMKSKLGVRYILLSVQKLSFSEAVKEISDLLNTGLDEETLKVCVQLLEAGVNPEALATVVRELRRETAALRVSSRYPAVMVLLCEHVQIISQEAEEANR